MNVNGKHYRSIWYDYENKQVKIIDQRWLPREFKITELGNIYSAILTDICFGIPAHNILQKKEGNSFGYLFSTQSKILKGKLGCFHASELPYVFGVHSKKPYSGWGPK